VARASSDQLHGKTSASSAWAHRRACRALGKRSAWRCSAGRPRAIRDGSAPRRRSSLQEDILARADVVSLHVRLSPENARLPRQERARRHEAHGILVNTAAALSSIARRS